MSNRFYYSTLWWFLCNIILLNALIVRLFFKMVIAQELERLKLTQGCNDKGEKIAASEVTLGKVYCT